MEGTLVLGTHQRTERTKSKTSTSTHTRLWGLLFLRTVEDGKVGHRGKKKDGRFIDCNLFGVHGPGLVGRTGS